MEKSGLKKVNKKGLIDIKEEERKEREALEKKEAIRAKHEEIKRLKKEHGKPGIRAKDEKKKKQRAVKYKERFKTSVLEIPFVVIFAFVIYLLTNNVNTVVIILIPAIILSAGFIIYNYSMWKSSEKVCDEILDIRIEKEAKAKVKEIYPNVELNDENEEERHD